MVKRSPHPNQSRPIDQKLLFNSGLPPLVLRKEKKEKEEEEEEEKRKKRQGVFLNKSG